MASKLWNMLENNTEQETTRRECSFGEEAGVHTVNRTSGTLPTNPHPSSNYLYSMALDFFAGCVGGIAGVVVGHPLDTVKVRIQTQDFRNPKYRGTWHCFSTILKTESVRGLYRGVTSPMGGVALVNAIVFGVYGNVQRTLTEGKEAALYTHFLSGVAAGVSQSIVCCPLELAKTRLQVQQNNVYKGTLDCLMKMAKAEGPRGVFRGLGVTVVREVPAFGLYFYTYELMVGKASLTLGATLLAGGLAGCLSWLVSYPVDVIKSRLQSDGLEGPRRYKGALDCLVKSVRTEGPRTLFRGLNSTLLRAFPTNAVTFATVHWILNLTGDTDTPPPPVSNSQPISIKLKIKSAFQYYEDERIDFC